MKKFLLGFIIGAVLFAAIPIGAAISEYKLAESTVKITVDGSAMEMENPPILYMSPGYNYIPAKLFREICAKIGVGFDWIAETNTIEIMTKGPVSNDKLKLYSRISNKYKELDSLGNFISMTSTSLSFAIKEIITTRKVDSFQEAYSDYNDTTIKIYNGAISGVTEIQQEAYKAGIDLSDMTTIMNKYNAALDKYGLAFLRLAEYAGDLSNDKLNEYTAAETAAYYGCLDGSSLARDGYDLFYSLLQDYK